MNTTDCASIPVTWPAVALAAVAALQALGMAWLAARNRHEHRQVMRAVAGQNGAENP